MQGNHPTRYLVWMFAALIGTLALCGAINVLVDPLGIFGSPRIAGFNATKPYLDHHRVLARWQAARRSCASAGIFGNSRAEIGLDPDHPVFQARGLEAFNHAIPGSSVTMAVQQLNWLQAAGCAPKEIVLGVEFFDFLGGSPLKTATFDSQPPQINLEVLAETVFSITALHDSVTTLAIQHARYPATLTERGFNPLLNYIPEVENAGHYVLFRQRAAENLKRWTSRAHRIHPESGPVSEDFAGLDAFLKTAQAAGSTVHVVIYPYHAEIPLMMDRIELSGLFNQWKAEIVASAEKYSKSGMKVEVIDFSGLSAETSEAIPPKGDRKTHLTYYWEAGHFKKALGDRMLARIFGGEAGFGLTLDSRTLALQQASDARKIEQERQTNSSLMQEVNSLFAQPR